MGKNSNVATPPVHGQLSFLRWLVLLPNYTVGPGSGANGKNAENADRVAVNRCHWTMSWSNEDESSLSSARFSLDPPFFPLFFLFFSLSACSSLAGFSLICSYKLSDRNRHPAPRLLTFRGEHSFTVCLLHRSSPLIPRRGNRANVAVIVILGQ